MNRDKVVLINSTKNNIKEVLEKNFKNIEVAIFETVEDFTKIFEEDLKRILKESKLLIIGTRPIIPKNYRLKLCSLVKEINPDLPLLFFVKKIEIKEILEEIQTKINPTCISDFIEEIFREDIFINRVSLLLRMSNVLLQLREEKQKIQINIWNLLNYSSAYTVVLDKDLKIVISSYSLAKFLGFNSEDELVGLDWLQFIPSKNREIVTFMLEKVREGEIKYIEATSEILDKEGKIHLVKWFRSAINGNKQGTFSIGIPVGVDDVEALLEDEESVRSYWRDVIQKDKTTITAIRDMFRDRFSK